MDKRYDNRGKLLRTREIQRKDGRYQFRYTDAHGNRISVYATTLNELRQKESEIEKSKSDLMDYRKGLTSVHDFFKRYMELKVGLRYSTKQQYAITLNVLSKEKFGTRPIGFIKVSDVKLWMIEMHRAGRGVGSLTAIKAQLAVAFDMAVEEDIVSKNPFRFKLADIVEEKVGRRKGLTENELAAWLNFVRASAHFSRFYDVIAILLETGMRVSELCGLTIEDLDFSKRTIRVDHQLLMRRDGTPYVSKPKTEAGVRTLPMSDAVKDCLLRAIDKRPDNSGAYEIDGISGFLFFNIQGKPMTGRNVDARMKTIMTAYRAKYPDDKIPNVTPHVLRHTFCTNMANAGIDPKSMQYLMGHSDVMMTLNGYADGSYEQAEREFRRVGAAFSHFGKMKDTL